MANSEEEFMIINVEEIKIKLFPEDNDCKSNMSEYCFFKIHLLLGQKREAK